MKTDFVKVEGDEEIAKKLNQIEDNLSRVILITAAKAAIERIWIPAMNRRAPGPNIVSKFTKRGAHSVEVAVGPDERHWFWRFLEFGAGAHEIKARSRNDLGLLNFLGSNGWIRKALVFHGGIAARPFMRPVFDETKAEIQKVVGDEIWKGIEATVK